MPINLWDSRELYQLQRDERLDAIPSFFLDTFFTESYYSEDSVIRFGKLPNASRVLAPFVLPTEQGKPIYKRKPMSINEISAPYIKPKDAVRAEDARNPLPEHIFRNGGGGLPSIEERFDLRVLELVEFHLRAIKMQKAWMAARAFIDGKVTINYERDSGAALPAVELNFGRAAGHTVTLSSGAYWSDPAADILGNLETWASTMFLADQGGAPNMLIVGASVAPAFRKNTGVKDMLDTTYRGGESVTIDRGISLPSALGQLKYIGQLSNDLAVYTYRDQVENANGTLVDILDPRDVLLIAPGATGVQAHGAIMDVDALEAGLANVDIFPKMWTSNDPGEKYIMHQSAPLPIPLYPNRTFKARVLA